MIQQKPPECDQTLGDVGTESNLESSESVKQRMPRHEFRKAKKLERRRGYRQAIAKERARRKENKRKEEKDNHAQYLEQQNAWLAKEAMFDKINAAKRKAREIESKAAKDMKASISRAISSIPVAQHAPIYQAPKKVSQPKIPQISNMPVFIASQSTSNDSQTD